MVSPTDSPPAKDGRSGGIPVTLRRTHAEDVQHRQIYVRIDDGPTHTLLFGDTVTMDVAPGEHTLKANNTLYWKTVRFSAVAGEPLEFMLVNRSSRLAFGFLTLLGAAPLKLGVERIHG